jgi:hypothetical protein
MMPTMIHKFDQKINHENEYFDVDFEYLELLLQTITYM